MNTFSGTITFKEAIDTSKIQDKHVIVESMDADGVTLFLFGQTKLSSSDEFIDSYKKFGEILSYDISISTEDNIAILNTDYEKDGLYEVASFEWPEVDYKDIIGRFDEMFEVICVREAEESIRYRNRIVKVDFIY